MAEPANSASSRAGTMATIRSAFRMGIGGWAGRRNSRQNPPRKNSKYTQMARVAAAASCNSIPWHYRAAHGQKFARSPGRAFAHPNRFRVGENRGMRAWLMDGYEGVGKLRLDEVAD